MIHNLNTTQTMRYYRFLLISLLVLVASDALACSDESYTPAGYRLYRVYDAQQDIKLDLNSIAQYPGSGLNCKSWQSITSETIPLEDIYKVVYTMPLAEFEKIFNNPKVKYENRFVEWITKRDRAILEFLYIAKTNEYIRIQRNSRWYYPTMRIDASMSLEQIAEKSLQSTDKRLRDRYLLQAVRAYFSLGMYQQCVDIWNGEASKLPADNAMRAMIHPYIAGAEFRLDNSQRAIEYFAQIGDVSSMLYCANRTGEKLSTVEAIELVYKYAPDSRYITQSLQGYVSYIEPDGDMFARDYLSSWEREQRQIRRQRIAELMPLCLAKAREDKGNSGAMWYYTAAFLSDLDGKTKQADDYLRLAEQCKQTDFMRESIMVMRIYLDAKLSKYDHAYEAKLFGQLKWLDSKIANNITSDVEKDVSEMYKLNLCRSFYYWNDVMRRIVLSEICPRMVKAGRYTRALQLANMADNRLLNLVDKVQSYRWVDSQTGYETVSCTMKQYRYSPDAFNSRDYSNHFFELIDSVGLSRVVNYVDAVRNPKGEFDRFLNARGYVAADYLNDILGTQALRNMKYDKAVEYLGAVSFEYNMYHLNSYMIYDPFSFERRRIGDYRADFDYMGGFKSKYDFKYAFAKEMQLLEQCIAASKEPNRKALLMMRYAVGIRNSFDACWALTHYYKGSLYFGSAVVDKQDWQSDSYTQAATAKFCQIVDSACQMATDKQIAAHIQYGLCNFKTVATKYADTELGEYVRGKCDKLIDYHLETRRDGY